MLNMDKQKAEGERLKAEWWDRFHPSSFSPHPFRDWRRPWRDPPGFLLPNCPCCGSGAQMYSVGGENSTPAVVGTADKTDMLTEVTAAVATANLSQARWELAGVANPAVAAYFAGGRTSPSSTVDQTTTDKLVFATDTTSAVGSAALSLARSQLAGLSERSTKGYFAGGLSASPAVYITRTDKITFSVDGTSAAGSASLSQARAALGGLSEGTSKGYWGGGSTGGGVPQVKTADKITFSGDSTSAFGSANLSVARFGLVSGSDGSTKGYWAGGETNSPLATTDKITFSTDTTTALATSFNTDTAASGSDANKLFGMGGRQGASGLKIVFATDVSSAVGTGSLGNLSQSRKQLAGATTAAL